ncbi:hypothetical protein [Psychromonas sp. Urea-02u-13]|uniref:hypothetical protein n=1 Tax=Psychromonas sp. Urea-02u-13 TaxID=2058326 RepID=UPI000C345250|nr:hypothetical protein [Psychromonas sp. Urea-02u-13]PKG37832.1 hypothetical protein CXF74_16860 [Psychromonas sp. Urea-02u-13]
MSTAIQDSPLTLEQLVQPLDAMQIAQLSAFALDIPQLYLCREYLQSDEQVAIKECIARLENGLAQQTFNLQRLAALLVEKDYFDSEEARLRLAPEPDFEELV